MFASYKAISKLVSNVRSIVLTEDGMVLTAMENTSNQKARFFAAQDVNDLQGMQLVNYL